MSRIVALICIRSLYPNFLFKRGSVVHIIFVACLLALLATSSWGCVNLVLMPLQYFEVPHALQISLVIGAGWVLLLIAGIRYGVTYA